MKNILTLLLLVLSLGIFAQEQADKQNEKQKIVIVRMGEIGEIGVVKYSSYDWALKGYYAQSEKKYSDACFYYQKAIELNPDDEVSYNNWGIALVNFAKQKGDESFYYKGIEKSKKAIGLNPDYADAYNNWGVALFYLAKQKDDESLYLESIEKCKKVIGLNPDYADAYHNWGIILSCLAKQKNDESFYSASIEKYKNAIELKSDHAGAYNSWGIALMDLAQLKDNLEEKKDTIIDLYRKAGTFKKGVGSYNLACLYALLNEKETALTWLEKSLQYVGRPNRRHYDQDADFNNIKEEPRFKALLDKYFQNE